MNKVGSWIYPEIEKRNKEKVKKKSKADVAWKNTAALLVKSTPTHCCCTKLVLLLGGRRRLLPSSPAPPKSVAGSFGSDEEFSSVVSIV